MFSARGVALKVSTVGVELRVVRNSISLSAAAKVTRH
jgi:hypothetical protein